MHSFLPSIAKVGANPDMTILHTAMNKMIVFLKVTPHTIDLLLIVTEFNRKNVTIHRKKCKTISNPTKKIQNGTFC